MAELLSDPTMALAIATLKDFNAPDDALALSPEVASVRLLSQCVGFNTAIELLLSLAQPLPPEAEPEKETWESQPLE